MRIIVEGLIGSGKTTLTKALAKALNISPQYESVDDNPFLELYYQNPTRWAFTIQQYFLYDRFSKHSNQAYILDRSLYGDLPFAIIQRENEYMSQDEYDTYLNHYHILKDRISPPHFCLHIITSPEVSLQRVKDRNRDCETNLPLDYLIQLNRHLQNLQKSLHHTTTYIPIDWNQDRSQEQVESFIEDNILPALRNPPSKIKP